MLSGCITNNILDPDKIKQTSKLRSETKLLENEIIEERLAKENQIEFFRRKLLELQQKLELATGEKNLYLSKNENGITLVILNKILFAPGSANVSKDGQDLLIKIANILKDSDKEIQVAGHTDNEPIKKTKKLYKSNWELSVARSMNVVHIFEETGVDPLRLCAIGFGEYKAIAPNKSFQGRGQNRRVEIIISEKDIKRTNFNKKSDKKKKIIKAIK